MDCQEIAVYDYVGVTRFDSVAKSLLVLPNGLVFGEDHALQDVDAFVVAAVVVVDYLRWGHLRNCLLHQHHQGMMANDNV